MDIRHIRVQKMYKVDCKNCDFYIEIDGDMEDAVRNAEDHLNQFFDNDIQLNSNHIVQITRFTFVGRSL